jgi:hypothetical protein
VAILQRYLLDEVLQPKFAGGKELTKGYTADPFEVAPRTDGQQYQIALLLRSTPLGAPGAARPAQRGHAAEEHVLLPQAATGMVMNPLR